MNPAEKAAFKFSKYKIAKFSYEESENADPILNLNFEVAGKYIQKTGTFELKLELKATEPAKDNKSVIDSTLILYFKFEDSLPLKDLPVYFYRNAIAIGFPYLRSFISTLTLQANTKSILLPIMNLSKFEQPLIDSTFQVTE
jgi:preprotein translocase subunit SecB